VALVTGGGQGIGKGIARAAGGMTRKMIYAEYTPSLEKWFRHLR